MPTRLPTFVPPRTRRKRDESARLNAHQRGYCDKRHRAWRRAVLTRDAWACVVCGKIDNANHADHVVPVLNGGSRYDVANGQTLCIVCHGRKTRHEQGQRPVT
jgi:5-methylcytosine-specific restriction endonuclease McrA